MTLLAVSVLFIFVVAFFVVMFSGDSGMGCIVPLHLLVILLCGLAIFAIAWLVLAAGCTAVFGAA